MSHEHINYSIAKPDKKKLNSIAVRHMRGRPLTPEQQIFLDFMFLKYGLLNMQALIQIAADYWRQDHAIQIDNRDENDSYYEEMLETDEEPVEVDQEEYTEESDSTIEIEDEHKIIASKKHSKDIKLSQWNEDVIAFGRDQEEPEGPVQEKPVKLRSRYMTFEELVANRRALMEAEGVQLGKRYDLPPLKIDYASKVLAANLREEASQERLRKRDWMMNLVMNNPDENMIKKASNEERVLNAAKAKMAKRGREKPLSLTQKNWQRRGIPNKLIRDEGKTLEEIEQDYQTRKRIKLKKLDSKRKEQRALESNVNAEVRRNIRNENDRQKRDELDSIEAKARRDQRNEKDRARRAQKKNNSKLS